MPDFVRDKEKTDFLAEKTVLFLSRIREKWDRKKTGPY
jgi:hypothetical protein